MLCVSINDALHVDESIEDLGIAGIFEVTTLPSPGYIVLVNCCSQLKNIKYYKSMSVIREAE